MSKILKTAVMGVGNMGRHHVRNYGEIDGSELVAICDNHVDRLNQFSQEYGCLGFTDFDDMLQNVEIDAMTIACPTSFHYDIAKKAILKGIHVLVEKPIAETVEKAHELTELAKERNVTLMVGHIERFNPAINVLKKHLDAGIIGDVTSLVSKRVGMFPSQIKDANVVIDLAVHDIDIFSYLLGLKPDSVKGNAGRAIVDDREDYADIFLTFGDKSGFLQVNWITPIRLRTLSVTGTEGYIELDYIKQEIKHYQSNVSHDVDPAGYAVIQFDPSDAQLLDVPKEEPLANEISHFLDCVRTGKAPLITGEMGKDALEIAHQVLDQISRKK